MECAKRWLSGAVSIIEANPLRQTQETKRPTYRLEPGRGPDLKPSRERNQTMNFLALTTLIVTMAPVLILGVVCVLSSVEASIREGIGR